MNGWITGGSDGADGRVLVRGGSLPVRSRAVVGLPLSLREVPRHSGAPVATFVGFPAGTVRWLGTEPKRYRSSKDVERSFCAACGSSIGFHRVHETSLYLGSFDAPSELPVADIWTGHVFYKDHIAWFDTADGWERHAEFSPGRTEELLALSGKPIAG